MRVSDCLFRTIRGRLTLLAVTVALPAVILAVLLAINAYEDQRAVIARQLVETSRALSLALDRQLGQAEATLQALATSPDLESGNLKRFYQQARAAVPAGGQWIILSDSSGGQIIDTRFPFGSTPPESATTPLHDPGLAYGKPHISDLIQGSSPYGAVITVTQRLQTQAGRDYALTMAIRPSNLQGVLLEQKLPAD